MRYFGLTVVLSTSVALISCQNSRPDCGPAWASKSSGIELRTLKRTEFLQVETKLIAEVDRCYHASDGIPDYPLSYLSDEFRDAQGQRYLVFDIYGVADVVFVAVVDRGGKIVRTGYSTMNF